MVIPAGSVAHGCRSRKRTPKQNKLSRETHDGFDQTSSGSSGYIPELDDAERASRDEIMALQTRRLAWSLAMPTTTSHITGAPSMRRACIPSNFKQLADLAKFPFTAKTDLRDNYPFGMFAVPREKVVRVHASSGTTGKPTVVGYTQGRHRRPGRRDGAFDPRRRRPHRR